MCYGIVYCYTNKINGKKYVGQTINPDHRKAVHKHALEHDWGYVFHKAIRKYGWDNFDYEVLYECNSNKEMNEREIECVAALDTLWGHGKGYNMSPGGGQLNPSSIEKMRQTKKRKYAAMTADERRVLTKKMCSGNVGKKQSEYQKQRARETLQKTWRVTHPDGREEVIQNLRAFSKRHNVDPGNLSCGKSKGFTATQVTSTLVS